MLDNDEQRRTRHKDIDGKPDFAKMAAKHTEAVGRIGALNASGAEETEDGDALDTLYDAVDDALDALMVCPAPLPWMIARKLALLDEHISRDSGGVLCNDHRELRWLALIRIDVLRLATE